MQERILPVTPEALRAAARHLTDPAAAGEILMIADQIETLGSYSKVVPAYTLTYENANLGQPAGSP
jgi:hypothetical protein